MQIFVKHGDPGKKVVYLLLGDFSFPGGLVVRQPLPPWLSGTAAHGCLFLPFLLVRAVFVVSLPSFLVTLSGLECSFSSYFEVCMGWLDANVC